MRISFTDGMLLLLGLTELATEANAQATSQNVTFYYGEDRRVPPAQRIRNIQWSPDFTDAEVNKACNKINGVRSHEALYGGLNGIGGANLVQLTTDQRLTRTVKQFLRLPYSGPLTYQVKHSLPFTMADWGYNDAEHLYNITRPVGANHWTSFHIMNQHPEFQRLARENNVTHITSKRIMFVTHDTWAPGRYFQILQLRLNQGWCMVFAKCGDNFTNHVSCGLYSYEKMTKDGPCQWSFSYYPNYVGAAQDCTFVNLHVPGRFVVQSNKQKDAFLTVTFSDQTDPVIDRPYQSGKACGSCPPGYTGCNHKTGLCLKVPTPQPTPTPTMLTQFPTAIPTVVPTASKRPTRQPTQKNRGL